MQELQDRIKLPKVVVMVMATVSTSSLTMIPIAACDRLVVVIIVLVVAVDSSLPTLWMVVAVAVGTMILSTPLFLVLVSFSFFSV
jgi:hypothetical protein